MNIEQLREALKGLDDEPYMYLHDASGQLVVEAAKACLSLLTSETHKIVPIEPTAEMIDEAYSLNEDRYNSEIYKAMLSASPKYPEETK